MKQRFMPAWRLAMGWMGLGLITMGMMGCQKMEKKQQDQMFEFDAPRYSPAIEYLN